MSQWNRRIMTITLFEVMPIMGPGAFIANLEGMLSIIHQEIDYFVKVKTGKWAEVPKKMTMGSRKVQLSQRKKTSRKFAKYDDVDVLNGFKNTMNVKELSHFEDD